MEIPLMLIADEANISQEGKLNVMGVFDRIASAAFPIIHPRMVVVVRFQAEFADSGKRFPVRIRLMDEDGGVVFEAGGEIEGPQIPPGEFLTANQIFGLVGVRFARAGSYKLVLNVGDMDPRELPLRIVQAKWGPQAPQGN